MSVTERMGILIKDVKPSLNDVQWKQAVECFINFGEDLESDIISIFHLAVTLKKAEEVLFQLAKFHREKLKYFQLAYMLKAINSSRFIELRNPSFLKMRNALNLHI